jgi:apolipoprotein N-acyltransferase
MKTHTSQTKATHVATFTSFMRATSKARKVTLLLFSVAMLPAGGAAAVCGQSALDGFDPNANGRVRVVVVQPDGKILIGGDFTTLRDILVIRGKVFTIMENKCTIL